ncbi:MAG: DUF3089 domain-containing protein [Pseudomonadota bacterium]
MLRRPLILLLLAGLTIFLGLVITAAIMMRDQIYQTALDPRIPYQTYTAPPAPDYAEASAWARLDPIDPDDPDAPAVFFIHPTTYDGGEHWNAPFDRAQEAEELQNLILPNYAEPFAAEASLAAPHYRQAGLYAFMNNREDALRARMFAYKDVERAFSVFAQSIGEERPFLIVGVGQGALHGLGLLMTQLAPDEGLRARLVAAYLLEAPTPLDLFENALSGLQPCNNADAVRCVISYNSASSRERKRIETLTERSMAWTPRGELGYVAGRGLVCVNPLLWTTAEDYAPARLHRGGAAAEALAPGDAPSPLSAQTGAQCQNGVLMIEEPRSAVLRRPGRLGEDRRIAPFNLFYFDLQADAQRRQTALAEILAEERRWAPDLAPPEEVEVAPVRPID